MARCACSSRFFSLFLRMSRESSGFTPPSKKGRKSLLCAGHVCGSCQVWFQLGSPSTVAHLHSSEDIRHPATEKKAPQFSTYLSMGRDVQFQLGSDSCLCKACYTDCLRHAPKMIERSKWQKHSQLWHCPLCDKESDKDCMCKDISSWHLLSDLIDAQPEMLKVYFNLHVDFDS